MRRALVAERSGLAARHRRRLAAKRRGIATSAKSQSPTQVGSVLDGRGRLEVDRVCLQGAEGTRARTAEHDFENFVLR